MLMGGCSGLERKMMNNKLRKSVQAPFFWWLLWLRVRRRERGHVGVVLHSRGVELMDSEEQNTGA